MSAIDNFANEPEFNDGVPDDQDVSQEMVEDRPLKKKSSLPLIGAGVVMVAAFSFVAYTKFIKSDSAAMPVAAQSSQAQVIEQAPPMQPVIQAPVFEQTAIPPMVAAMPSAQESAPMPAIGFNSPSQQGMALNAAPIAMPQVEAQIPEMPAVGVQTQPEVSAATAPVQAVEEESSEAFSDLNEKVVAAHEKIESLEDKLDALQASIDALLTKIETIEKKTPIAKKPAVQPASTEKAPVKRAAKVKTKPTKTVMAESAAEKYSVYAMRADRVWVRTESGKTMNFAKGETIPGAGRIEEINLDKRMVELSTGARLVTR